MLGVLLVCLGSGTWELPPGILRERLLALAPEQAPADFEEELGTAGTAPGLESAALEDARVWRLWHRSLATLLAKDDARAHARLALVALDQGRARDAWEHLEACSGDAGLLAALAPRFLPGVPRGTPLAKAGQARALPDGCVLRPALPPPIDERAPDDERRARRRVGLAGIEIGRARVGLTITVEAEGVQVELAHESGEATHVSIVIPRSEDYAVGAEYVDWFKQETLGAPLSVELKPGEEPHVLFARFEPRDPRWPTRLPEVLPAAIEKHGLVLVAPPDGAQRAVLAEIASALSFPELKLACRLRGAAETSPGGIEVDLGGAGERSDKLAWLVSSIERFATRKTAPR